MFDFARIYSYVVDDKYRACSHDKWCRKYYVCIPASSVAPPITPPPSQLLPPLPYITVACHCSGHLDPLPVPSISVNPPNWTTRAVLQPGSKQFNLERQQFLLWGRQQKKNLFMLYLRLWAVLVDQSYINDVSWLILVCARVIHTYSHVIDIFITVGAYLICIWHSSEKDLISLRHYPCKYIWFPFDYYAEFHNWHRQEGSDFSHVWAPRPVHYGWKALLVRIELSNILSDHRADMCNSLTFRFHDTESMERLGVWFGV